jgi:hypothetical protein
MNNLIQKDGHQYINYELQNMEEPYEIVKNINRDNKQLSALINDEGRKEE